MNARSVTVSVTPALVPAIALLQNMHDKVMALPDLKSLERTVHEQLKEVDRLTMELCLVDKIRQSAPALTYEVRCRHCGPGWAVRSAPAAPRYAITVRGRVDYTRPVYRCDQPGCGRERSPGKERPVLLRRAYCATSRGIRPFGAMVWALANWWGVRSARRVAVVGDGIDWIWNWSRDRLHFALPDGGIQAPVEIVDFWHGAENLAKARGAIYADPEGSAARAWFERWRHRLRQGEIEPLVKELKRRAARAGGEAARHELSLRAQYFAGHAHRRATGGRDDDEQQRQAIEK